MKTEYELLLECEAQIIALQDAHDKLFEKCFKKLGKRLELQKKDFARYSKAAYRLKDCKEIGDILQTFSTIYERIA